MEIFDAGMNYKNAERCEACPKRNDEEGCPFWWEFVQTDMSSGKERLVKQCGKQAMAIFMVEVIKASNRPAAAVESTRNEIVNGFENLLAMLRGALQALQAQSHNKPVQPGFFKRMLGRG